MASDAVLRTNRASLSPEIGFTPVQVYADKLEFVTVHNNVVVSERSKVTSTYTVRIGTHILKYFVLIKRLAVCPHLSSPPQMHSIPMSKIEFVGQRPVPKLGLGSGTLLSVQVGAVHYCLRWERCIVIRPGGRLAPHLRCPHLRRNHPALV